MLELFPLEVLQQVFGKLHGYDIGALWLTGNRILAHKMSEGSVQSLIVPVASRRRMSSFWPAMSAHFHGLRSFKILRNEESSIPLHITWEKLTELPSSLTSLCVQGTPSNSQQETWPPIEALFPLLTELDIGPICANPPRTDAEPPLELPKILYQSTLISLTIWTRRDLLPMLLKAAPPGMTYLSFSGDGPSCLGLDDHIFQLPKSLQKLKITGLRGTSEFADPLPPGLNYLKLDSTFDRMVCQRALQGTLPPMLSTLKLTSFHQGFVDSSVLRGLPRNLMTLSLRCRATLSEEAMKLLPPSLTRLDLLGSLGTTGTETDMREVPMPWELPKNLKILRSNVDINALSSQVSALPSSLRHLQTLNDCSEYLPSLPRHLTFLSCTLAPEAFSHLPSTLTFLVAGVTNLEYRNKHRKTGSFCLTTKETLWPSLPPLPASLTSLRCSLQCYSPLDFLPLSLRNLNLRIMNLATTDSEPDSSADIDPSWAKHLPPQLVSLILNAEVLPLSAEVFEDMPCRSKLIMLQLRADPPREFDSSIFARLPPRLTVLIIRISKMSYPESHLPQLPQRIECLLIEIDDPSGPGVKPQHLRLLPPRVGEFRLPRGDNELIAAGAELGIAVYNKSTCL